MTGVGDIVEPILQNIATELYLLPGDLNLSGYEEALSAEWPNSMGDNNLYRPMRILSSFWQVMQMSVQNPIGYLCQQHSTQVELSIGPLSGVELELLQHAFPIAAAGSCAATACLTITTAAVTIYCPECDQTTIVAPNRLLCPHCGNWQTQLKAGDELILQRVELED